MSKVSVIVPNYNHAPYLKQRIDSIINQTYQDIELIILDDCSTDNSKEIIEQYRNNPKVSQIVYNTENSGSTFKQWDKGISLAKGEYIWIAESDDWCEPTLVETLMQKLNSDAKIVFGYVQSYYVVGNEIGWVSKQNYLENVMDGTIFVKNHLLWANVVFNASMAIFRKNCFDKIDKIYTKFKFCGDWLFWGLVAIQGDVFISGKILNYFRKHPADISGNAFASGLNYIEDIEVIYYFYQKGYVDRNEFKSALQLKYKNFVLKNDNLSKYQIIEIQNKFKQYIKIRSHYNWAIMLEKKLRNIFEAYKIWIKTKNMSSANSEIVI